MTIFIGILAVAGLSLSCITFIQTRKRVENEYHLKNEVNGNNTDYTLVIPQ